MSDQTVSVACKSDAAATASAMINATNKTQDSKKSDVRKAEAKQSRHKHERAPASQKQNACKAGDDVAKTCATSSPSDAAKPVTNTPVVASGDDAVKQKVSAPMAATAAAATAVTHTESATAAPGKVGPKGSTPFEGLPAADQPTVVDQETTMYEQTLKPHSYHRRDFRNPNDGETRRRFYPGRKWNDPPHREKDNVQVENVKVSKVEKVEKYNPVPDMRSLEEIVSASDDLRVLFYRPPFKFAGQSFKAVVQDRPFHRFSPIWYRFIYTVEMGRNKKGEKYPYVHVEIDAYSSYYFKESRSVDIEAALLLQCFNFTTMTEASRLFNNAFMTVNRSVPDHLRLSYDVSDKLMAITALHLVKHPDNEFDPVSMLRCYLNYVPIAGGIYAIGSTDMPNFGDPTTKVHMRGTYTPRISFYRARLLDTEYVNIGPYFMPALTEANLAVAAAKRLTPPSYEFSYKSDFFVLDSLEASRSLIKETVNVLLKWRMPIASQVEVTDDVISACAEHARKAFNVGPARDRYVEGARIAMEESINSFQFEKCLKKCVEVKCFNKDEVYTERKPLRFIMSPSEKARGFCHALLYNVQERLWGHDETLNPCCIKHMNDPKKIEVLQNAFGDARVCQTDWSAMEGSVNKWHMIDIEREIFLQLAEPNMKDKIKALWDRYIAGNYHAVNKYYEFDIKSPMRLSGQDHTSAGNWCCNFVWLLTIIRVVSGQFPKMDKFKIFVEGDDAIFLEEFELEDGTMYKVEPDKFAECSHAFGARLKIITHNNVSESSFCGVKLAEGVGAGGEWSVSMDLDEMYIISKILWSMNYDPCSTKNDGALIYARALSFLPRVTANEPLYDAIYWLAMTHQQKGNLWMKKTWFKRAWRSWKYKGDDEDLEIDESMASFDKFLEKHKLPKRDLTKRPELLCVVHDPCNMEIEQVEDARDLALKDRIARFAFGADPMYTNWVTMAEDQGRCFYYAIFSYLVYSGQLDVDAEMNSKEYYNAFEHWHSARSIRGNYYQTIGPEVFVKQDGLNADEVGRVLTPGQYIDVLDYCGVSYRLTADDEGGLIKEPITKPQVCIMFSTGHARLVKRKPPIRNGFAGLADVFVFAIALFVFAILAWTWARSLKLGNIPVYALFGIADAVLGHYGMAGLGTYVFPLAAYVMVGSFTHTLAWLVQIVFICVVAWYFFGSDLMKHAFGKLWEFIKSIGGEVGTDLTKWYTGCSSEAQEYVFLFVAVAVIILGMWMVITLF